MLAQMASRVATGRATSALFDRPKSASRPTTCGRRHAVVVRASASVPSRMPERVVTGVAWASLFGYALVVAPKGSEALDFEMVSNLVAAPFSGTVNYLFESLFNSFAIIPAVYAALLMPGI